MALQPIREWDAVVGADQAHRDDRLDQATHARQRGQDRQATVEVRSVGDYAESLPKSLRELYETLESAVRNELPDVSLKVGKGQLLMLKRRWATACYLRPQQKALRLLARLPSVPAGNGLGTLRGVQPDDAFKVQAHLRAPKDVRPALELIKAAYQETGRSLGEKS